MQALVSTGILVTVSVLRLLVAIPLFTAARRNRLTNLYWLSAQFLCLVIALPFAAIGIWNVAWIFWTLISLSEIALVMFVHTTFYQGRRSPMPMMLIVAGAGLVGGLVGNAINNFSLSAWLAYPPAILIWGWHFVEAYRAYGSITTERATEDWVKARYVMMIGYSLLDCVGSLIGTFSTTGLLNGSMVALSVVALNFAGVGLQLLTWAMPEWFRNWLNRHQQARIQELSKTEALTIINVLSSAMAHDTGLTSIVCAFALRKTISKHLGTDESQAVNQRVALMAYKEWEEVFQSPVLATTLLNSGGHVSVEQAIYNAKRALIEKQSLFTLSAK